MSGRFPIFDVQPVVERGTYPAKTTVGEPTTFGATVFREGHDAVCANVRLVAPDGTEQVVLMHPVGQGLDHWAAEATLDEVGPWRFRVEAWSDPAATWRHDAGIKIPAGVDVDLMLEEGARLFERGQAVVAAEDVAVLRRAVAELRDVTHGAERRLRAGFAPDLLAALTRNPIRDLVTDGEWHDLIVERERALFGSWYEFFPRSVGAKVDPTGQTPPVSGTFATAAERLPAIAEMGFDVVYLPPIHPIGVTNRKGPNNTLTPGPHDPGSPWAIGAAEGGHDAVHPDLGTLADFDDFVAKARELGLEIALDLALQATPDHPWVREGRKFFTERADGTIAYAENPPKKYQDIYPLNFDNDREGIYQEVLRIVRFWMDRGVRIFRVDNPHTKPVDFWHWLLGKVRETDPDVIFLAEAFTRPAMMHGLGKVGFQQSYTYFTWRNTRHEFQEYLEELSGPASYYMRPNFFANTPDINPFYLQRSGPPGFKIRAVAAAMSSPTWGIYSGYELAEGAALAPGKEEYLDSEKFQLRPRDYDSPDSIAGYISLLNRIRREHVSLRRLRNITFHHSDNEAVWCWSKREVAADGSVDCVLVVLNHDPHHAQETTIRLNMPALGAGWHDDLAVRDLITGASYMWREHNYVRLDPHHEPAHVLEVRVLPRR